MFRNLVFKLLIMMWLGKKIDAAFYICMRLEGFRCRLDIDDDHLRPVDQWYEYVYRYVKISKVIRGSK